MLGSHRPIPLTFFRNLPQLSVAVATAFFAPDSNVAAQSLPAWNRVSTSGPGQRALHAMAYDSIRNRTVLFGGEGGMSLGETWEWNGSAWLPQVSAFGPSHRSGHAMAYDSHRGKVILFGGMANNSPGFFPVDTWEYNGVTWTQVCVNGPSLALHSMIYDSMRQKLVLFGGYRNSGIYSAETWEWDGSAWNMILCASSPVARVCHAMAYDPVRGKTVLFGGGEPSYSTGMFLSDTWEYDGSNWVNASQNGPSPRSGHGMAYEINTNKIVLFGGANVSSNFLSDTWEWDGLQWISRQTSTTPSGRASFAIAYDAGAGVTTIHGGQSLTRSYLDETWQSRFVGVSDRYGNSCGPSGFRLNCIPSARPIIGTVAQSELQNCPSTVNLLSIGWSRQQVGNQSLPLSLSPYGLEGCELLNSWDSASLPTGMSNGTSIFQILIPNLSALVGAEVFLQGYCRVPGYNSGDAILSNGLRWLIGVL